jgi:hypothetical protein
MVGAISLRALLSGAVAGRMGVAVAAVASVVVGLAGVAPARPAAAASADCDRARVVTAWRYGGSQVHAAAEQALLGSDDDVCAFLSTGWKQRQQVDDRLQVDQMMAAGGSSLKQAAQQALDATEPAALGDFLQSGWMDPADTDLRVRANQMMAAGGPQLRAAAQAALDGPAAYLHRFLTTGRYFHAHAARRKPGQRLRSSLLPSRSDPLATPVVS